MPIDERYSRTSFDSAGGSQRLSGELARILTERLRRAAAPAEEVRSIVAALRSLGHDLCSWDEDEGCQTWGGDYTRPQPNRMILEFRYADLPNTSVEVSFGPWPAQPSAPVCPSCGADMSPSSLRIRGSGHGRVTDVPPTRIEVSLGELDSPPGSCGARSTGYEVSAFWCATCAGVWIPNARAGKWFE